MKIKRGDTRNGIHGIIKKKGKLVNLTDCHVLIYMDNGIKSYVDVLDAEKGEVYYPLEESAVNKAGFYNYEFKIIYPDGRPDTFPNDSFLKLRIYDDLGGD